MTQVAEFIFGCKGKHKMILAPKPLKMMSASDASYGNMWMVRVAVLLAFVVAKSWRLYCGCEVRIPMYVDSTCAMQMMKQGSRSFKRAKHIEVRFLWMKDLIDEGKIKLIHVPTE